MKNNQHQPAISIYETSVDREAHKLWDFSPNTQKQVLQKINIELPAASGHKYETSVDREAHRLWND